MEKVKVISANGGIIPELTWYASRIGEEFSVNEFDSENGVFVDIEGDEPLVGHISFGDYELLTPKTN